MTNVANLTKSKPYDTGYSQTMRILTNLII